LVTGVKPAFRWPLNASEEHAGDCYDRATPIAHFFRFRLSRSHRSTTVDSVSENDMIELVQFPWSPFCLVQRRILEYSGTKFKVINIPPQDRSLVWKLTRQRYYGVPVLMDGRADIFEVGEESQVIGKYLDSKLGLGLFPAGLEGVQSILWRFIENEIEGATFRLNDIHYKEFVRSADQLQYLRFKERKFGRGCLDQWRAQQKMWLKKLEENLLPFEEMLMHSTFLLGEQPRFVDFDLFGMLENFLYSGHYKLPARHKEIRKWHARMTTVKFDNRREKLHSRHQRTSP
jgi:glutathione S-transferase